MEAIAAGESLASVREALKARERRRGDLTAKLEHLDGLAKLPRLDPTALTDELRDRLTDWQGLLTAEPVKARQVLRKLLVGRLVFHPDPDRGLYTFEGKASYGKLVAGTVLQNVWCPRGDSNTRHAV